MIAKSLDLNLSNLKDPNNRISKIEDGFSVEDLKILREELHLNLEKFADLLGTSPRTLQRLKSKTNISISESVIDIVDIYEVALQLMGDVQSVNKYMESPNLNMNDKTPLELCKTAIGRSFVYTTLNQVKYGIMS